MKSSLVLILAVSIFCSVAGETSKLVNWRYDNDTIPEMLPRNMLGKSNEEIETAVFNAYQKQIRVVSEYSGHVYDPEFPYGYFKNEVIIPNTDSYAPSADFIFDNNVVRGLTDYNENVIIVKWAPDQIETNVEWKEANIRGNYYYSNSTYFDQGNYYIQLENLKYQAYTTLTENTMKYPSSVPSSSISYKSVKASFSGNIPAVTNVDNSYGLKYFLEEVAFQHISDNVAKSMQPNISIAVRQAIRPYIMFKNVSDPHFKGFNASTPSGIQLTVDDVSTHGLNQTYQRSKNITVDMINKKLISKTELVMHYLSGNFRVQLIHKDGKEYVDYADFEIERIKVYPVSNMFDRDDCYANTTITNLKVTVNPEKLNLSKDEEIEVNNALAEGDYNTLKKKFDKTVCVALADMLNSKAGQFDLPQIS